MSNDNMTIEEFTYLDLVEMFTFLDDLRESGKTNMFGAGPYLAEEFALTKKESWVVLKAWQQTFDGETDVEDRVDDALSQEA